jgi:hypothetical protein
MNGKAHARPWSRNADDQTPPGKNAFRNVRPVMQPIDVRQLSAARLFVGFAQA